MIYIASPAFNEFEILVRDLMVKEAKNKFPNENLFDPFSTEYSKEYSKHPTEEIALKIYKDNINKISESDITIFPIGTTDLGTIADLFCAIKLKKPIYGYDYLSNSFQKIDVSDEIYNALNINESVLVRVNKVSDAAVLGFNFNNKKKIYYELMDGQSDNIMLRSKFIRVKKDESNSYKTVDEFDGVN